MVLKEITLKKVYNKIIQSSFFVKTFKTLEFKILTFCSKPCRNKSPLKKISPILPRRRFIVIVLNNFVATSYFFFQNLQKKGVCCFFFTFTPNKKKDCNVKFQLHVNLFPFSKSTRFQIFYLKDHKKFYTSCLFTLKHTS